MPKGVYQRDYSNVIGKRFGRLQTIGIYGHNKRGETLILCQCDCGNKSYHVKHKIISGQVKSCGCLYKEGSKPHQYNRYDLSGPIGKGYTNKGEEFLFDVEDYDKVKGYCWYIDSNGFLRTTNKTITMHRLLTDCPKGLYVDHINHNRQDNRKCNIRVCTGQQNVRNRKVNGVTFDGFKYIARICIDGDQRVLGRFNTYEEAKAIRREAELQYFGEYAYNGD